MALKKPYKRHKQPGTRLWEGSRLLFVWGFLSERADCAAHRRCNQHEVDFFKRFEHFFLFIIYVAMHT